MRFIRVIIFRVLVFRVILVLELGIDLCKLVISAWSFLSFSKVVSAIAFVQVVRDHHKRHHSSNGNKYNYSKVFFYIFGLIFLDLVRVNYIKVNGCNKGLLLCLHHSGSSSKNSIGR